MVDFARFGRFPSNRSTGKRLIGDDSDGQLPMRANGNPASIGAEHGWDFVLAPYLGGANFHWGWRYSLKPDPNWRNDRNQRAVDNIGQIKFMCPGAAWNRGST